MQHIQNYSQKQKHQESWDQFIKNIENSIHLCRHMNEICEEDVSHKCDSRGAIGTLYISWVLLIHRKSVTQ